MKKPRGKDRRRNLRKQVATKLPRRFIFTSLIVITAMGMAFVGFIFRNNFKHRSNATASSGQVSQPLNSPRKLSELLALQPLDLAGLDIGLMNLLCAEGLKGSEKLDTALYLKRLDSMAEYVRSETRRNSYKFRQHPGEFRDSKGYFQMLYLVSIIQQDFGIHYNPDRITPVGVFEPNDIFFTDARDVFINGAIDPEKQTGTCASLPVMYVAIGRRLGYPLKLVPTKNHLFIRWEDEHERFNVDGTSVGLNVYDDEKYREWPFHVSEEEMREFGYLRSMTPAEELCAFLALRGHCLFAAGRLEEGLAAHETALRFAPDNRLQQLILADMKQEVTLRGQQPDYLPPEERWRGNIPANVESHEAEVDRLVWQAEQLSKQKRGELSRFVPPGTVPIPSDPNLLKQIQNQFNNP